MPRRRAPGPRRRPAPRGCRTRRSLPGRCPGAGATSPRAVRAPRTTPSPRARRVGVRLRRLRALRHGADERRG
ncbi:hypothetical protein DJ72_11305, partial [Halorubrum distributum]